MIICFEVCHRYGSLWYIIVSYIIPSISHLIGAIHYIIIHYVKNIFMLASADTIEGVAMRINISSLNM